MGRSLCGGPFGFGGDADGAGGGDDAVIDADALVEALTAACDVPFVLATASPAFRSEGFFFRTKKKIAPATRSSPTTTTAVRRGRGRCQSVRVVARPVGTEK